VYYSSVRVLAFVLGVAALAFAFAFAPSEAAADDAGAKRARVVFEVPAGVTALTVVFDGAQVPVGSMTMGVFMIDPGDHVVSARGMCDGKEVTYEARFHFEPGDFRMVQLPMAEVPSPPPQESGCLVPSRTEEDMRACVAVKNAPPQGCGACAIGSSPARSRSPLWLGVLPIVTIARRLARRRRAAAR
jgi:hypothetical protein